MGFVVDRETRKVGGGEQEVYTLRSEDNQHAAEIWPQSGCNCLRWRASDHELLYVAPDWETNPVPTRSGIPILFPFPNRIREGKFTWEGKQYSIPPNDSTGKNAIHGFVCRRPWRVIRTDSDSESATLVAEFQGSIDAPEVMDQWPGDYRISIQFMLERARLGVLANINNPGNVALPLGLGYHPYFRLPGPEDGPTEGCFILVPAETIWELRDNLPTGRIIPVDATRNLNDWRHFDELELDDVFTNASSSRKSDWDIIGYIMHQGIRTILLIPTASFRETVVFTPPHRQAICVEPYTCVTDAINLHQRGIDSGLIVLEPGQQCSHELFMTLPGNSASRRP